MDFYMMYIYIASIQFSNVGDECSMSSQWHLNDKVIIVCI